MKRHKSLIALSHDHHHGLMLAQLIKKNAPAYKGLPTDLKGKVKYTLEAWEKELKLHFHNEENILFPFIKEADSEIDKLIIEIVAEHIEIKALVDKLEKTDNEEEILNELGYKLEAHIRKEERQLFPLVESIFAMKLDDLVGKIISIKESCDT